MPDAAPRKTVFVTRVIPDAGPARLASACLEVSVHHHCRGLSADELAAAIASHDALLCLLTDRIDERVLAAGVGRCQIVANCAVGYDNIDIRAAARLGITVTNTPDVLTESTADLTWALILAAARRLGESERSLRAGQFHGWGIMDYLGVDVYGRTLGVLGAGRIGAAVARRASGFNMPLLYHNRRPSPAMHELGAHFVSLDELLTESDILSLHVPLTPSTRHMIDAAALARMKPGAVLINTARGPIIDEAALVAALRAGRLAAAGLDVYEHEPQITPALLELENVVLLPHIGSATVATRSRMAEIAAENIIAVLEGRPPPNPIPVPV